MFTSDEKSVSVSRMWCSSSHHMVVHMTHHTSLVLLRYIIQYPIDLFRFPFR
jgi:hypothetical protein